jgi:FKBP-type peptidyl-prolyl cis-trans isomerase FklB
VVVLPSGLQYVVLKPGTGRQPTLTDTVQCSYRATLLDGTEFICTNPGQPAILKVEGADFKGWKEALLLMSAGAHWRCYVPSNLAYGQRGVGREVPPNSTIILDLELVAIQ